MATVETYALRFELEEATAAMSVAQTQSVYEASLAETVCEMVLLVKGE